jgi:hypothetical protein
LRFDRGFVRNPFELETAGRLRRRVLLTFGDFGAFVDFAVAL